MFTFAFALQHRERGTQWKCSEASSALRNTGEVYVLMVVKGLREYKTNIHITEQKKERSNT